MDIGTIFTMILLTGINVGGFVFCAVKNPEICKQ